MALTTLAKVKAHAEITTGDYDTLLTTILNAVDAAMLRWMDRVIEETSTTGEVVPETTGRSPVLQLRHYPIKAATTPVVRYLGTVVAASEYDVVHANGQLVRVASGVPVNWTRGVRVYAVDYTHGYATVPADLDLAAQKQVRHEFHQAKPSGRDRLGEISKAVSTGGTLTFERDGFLPSVIQAMAPFRRVA